MISTHVLDTATGRPAAALAIRLERRLGEGWETLSNGVTDAEGRLRDWPGEEVRPAGRPVARTGGGPAAGVYRLVFDTGGWFAASDRVTFYPEVFVVFEVTDPAGHHHVPLLLAPFGYSTYRGS